MAIQTDLTEIPPWVDTKEYPFASRWFASGEGQMHWVETGAGEPVVFVHGTPTWSFEWRHQLQSLGKTYRCLALDHLGFGLSDKPTDASYRPEDHARRFAAWVDQLNLKRFSLVVHDYGGPVGLSWALAYPEKIRSLVLLNTWLWPLTYDSHFTAAGKLLGGAVGRFLYLRLNFSPKVILPAAYGDRNKLTRAVHRQYLAPFSTRESRQSAYALAQSLLGSTDWYASLWERRERLKGIPLQLIWGMKDTAFRPQELARWQEAFPEAKLERLPDAGHWPQEEEPEQVSAIVRRFLQESPIRGEAAG